MDEGKKTQVNKAKLLSCSGIYCQRGCYENCWRFRKIAENLECYRNLFGKTVARFEMTESNFEKVLLWIKACQTALHAAEKTVHGMNWPQGRSHCLILIGKPPQLMCQELSASIKARCFPGKNMLILKARVTINISSNKAFWIKILALFFRTWWHCILYIYSVV